MFRLSRIGCQEAWREAGISYLKYLNICTECLHKCVKERSQSRYSRFSTPGYITQAPDGVGGYVDARKVPAAVKDYK